MLLERLGHLLKGHQFIFNLSRRDIKCTVNFGRPLSIASIFGSSLKQNLLQSAIKDFKFVNTLTSTDKKCLATDKSINELPAELLIEQHKEGVVIMLKSNKKKHYFKINLNRYN